ncbi:MAG: phosphotransferase [Microbacterium sp.]
MTSDDMSSGVGGGLRRMLHDALWRTAVDLGVRLSGDVVYGWRDRSIGSAVERGREVLWLRIVWARAEWARGAWWTGNRDAGGIRIDTKPTLLESREHTEGEVVFRAELMTLAPGSPCASTPELRDHVDIDGEWWSGLERSLITIAATPTPRMSLDPISVRRRIAVFFGYEIDTDPARWVSCHGDLHWNNIHADPLAIVDWEAWGLAPRGYDAAFLLGHSLGVPAIASEVTRRFRDDLDSDDGVIAQLYVLTKMLTRADGGAHPELIAPIHRHADRLLGRAPVSRPLTLGVNP